MLSPLLKQAWYVSPILLIMLGQGTAVGFASCLIQDIQTPESTIKASVEEMSWIVASFGIAFMFGYVISSLLMDTLGRRIAFIIVCLPFPVGSILFYSASDVAFLVYARIITGVSCSAAGILGPVIIGELCSPQYRGMFLNLKSGMLYVGSLSVHVLGHYIHWKTVALICSTPFVLALFIEFTCPETPSWLIQKQRFQESEEVFYNLRGISEDSKREINSMIRAQRATIMHKRTFMQKIGNIAMKFTKRNFLKPAMLMVFAGLILETGGRHILPSYAALIITKITGNSIDAFLNTFAVDSLLILSLSISAYLIRVVKVRTLLFSTGFVSCVVLCFACIYLYLVDKEVITNVPSISIALFAIHFFFVNLGCVPIPLVILSEIFPVEHKAVGISFGCYLISFFMTIGLKIMPEMMQRIGVYGAFSVLNLLTAVSLVVLWFILPETKDRTLQEIEDYFTTGRFRNSEIEEEVNLEMIRKKDCNIIKLENKNKMDT